MKKLLLTLIMLLTLLTISCSNKATAPTTNNQNSKVMNSFSGTFQFGNFGNVSALGIKDDNTIYMPLDNSIIEIDKNMVDKLSDTKYKIEGYMPNINNTSAKYLMLNTENSSYINLNLDIVNNNLSLSGEVANSPINANLIGTGSSFNAKYAGIYRVEGIEGAEYIPEYEVKDNGDVYFTSYDINTGEIIIKDDRKAYLIKESDNIYDLITPGEEFTGVIDERQAEKLIDVRAMKYYNISDKTKLIFSDNELIEEGYSISIGKETSDPYYQDAVKKVMADTNYLDQIDYTIFKVEYGNKSTMKWIKK